MTPLTAQISIDFKGGSLGSLLDKIRAETDYNLIASKMASDVALPALQIKEASLLAADSREEFERVFPTTISKYSNESDTLRKLLTDG